MPCGFRKPLTHGGGSGTVATVPMKKHTHTQRDSHKSSGAVGIAFGSGGARGLAHLGVLQALEELGLAPDIVVGTSIGAIAAAAYATGTVQVVRESFLSMSALEVSRMFIDFNLPRSGLIEGRHVMEKLGEWIPDIEIGLLRIPFAAVAMDTVHVC